ncbi:MAG: hypothetical protein P4M09_15065 [Devosia sp.]|nr:hypothetical protein [Devosia sp.]
MKITGIRALVVAAPSHRNQIVVKAATDRPELYGWGEATLEWETRSPARARAQIDDNSIRRTT